MKKKIKIAVMALAFGLCLSSGVRPAYAETMTVPIETASDDNSLSSLRVAQAELDPEFDPQQLTYTVTVPYDVTRIAVTADTASPLAQKVINGTGDLTVGENVVTVTVTAENGSVREYRITVIREDAGGGETAGETPAETAQTEEPQTEADPTQASETEPQQTAGEGNESTQAGAGETSAQTNETPAQTVSGETEAGQGMVTIPAGDREQDNGSEGLSSGNIFILVLGIFCLVLLFVIIAALLLRKGSGRDDGPDGDDEMDDLDDIDEIDDMDDMDGHPYEDDYAEDYADDDEDNYEEDYADDPAEDTADYSADESASLDEDRAGARPLHSEGEEDIAIVDLDDSDDSLEDDEDFDLLDF